MVVFFALLVVVTWIAVPVTMTMPEVIVVGMPLFAWVMHLGYWVLVMAWYSMWVAGFDHLVNRDEIAELMGEDFARRVWR